MTEIIYGRIKHIIEAEHKHMNLKPYGFGVEGQWFPSGINSCFRYSRYQAPSVGFDYHRDSCYVETADKRSVLTLLIYLNDDYDGGTTDFVQTKSPRKIGQIVSEEMAMDLTLFILTNQIRAVL